MTSRHRRKTVAFVLQKLHPGGAERALITLMNNLDREKYDVHFICISGQGDQYDWINHPTQIHNLNTRTIVTSLEALYKTLKAIKADTVIATMVQANSTLLLLKPFLPKTRFIIRESSLPSIMLKNYGLKSLVCGFAYQYLYPRADIIIGPAQIIIDEFKSLIKKPANYVVLYNSVQQERTKRAIESAPLESYRDVIKFVCVGRLEPEKGYDRLLKHLNGFSTKNAASWTLTILGQGAEKERIIALIKKMGLQNNVRLLGHSSAPEQYMVTADCLLLPSRWEGMPNVVLESLACGTPVIAHTKAGGINEIAAVTQKGDLTIAEDMPQFIEAMKNVNLRLLKETPKSKLPDLFSLPRIIQKLETLL